MPSIRPFVTKHLSNRSTAVLVVLMVAVSANGRVAAEERFAEFVDGLRQRNFHDTALEYLDGLAKRTDLPLEFAQTLNLERGITYRAQATASRIAEDREQSLAQAELALKAFIKRHNDHPRAPFANSELGQLLFERARSLLWDSEAPSNANRKAELQQQARTLIDQAKGIYQTAHDQYKKQYDGYPKFIDKAEDPDAFQERLSAEVKYLRAWFSLTRCTYERGQTFDKGSKERKETLVAAANEFEAIHSARRTNPIGLQSRLMMGKCFQEQDDIGRALGIYQEILSHTAKEPFVQLLRSIALQYRLICLNDEQKNDFQLVLQEADVWLKDKDNRRRLHTEVGLGILWEKAIAGEKMGLNRTVEVAEKVSYQRQALADAKNVGRFPGPYREAAVAMSRRLNAELGDKDAEPKDFDTAFERASGLLTQRDALKANLTAAKSGADKQKARQAMDRQMNEIGRLLELALSLRDEDTDKKAAAQARYLLSYAYYSQRKSFDAIVLARYCMSKDRVNNPDAALSATEIAIAAAIQSFNDAGEDQSFELNLLQEICNLIISQYPQSSKGNEARFRLGQVYRDLNEPLKAAETYLSVPQDYSQYPSSRIQAGQSYWLSWVKTMARNQRAEEPETDSATLDTWKAEATKQLQAGIKLSREKLGKDAQPTAEIIAAEVSLATILNMDGKYAATIKNLTAGAGKSVMKSLDVPDGQERPAKGIQSAAFAGQAYRLLLRAYVGTQNIDAALATMAQLQGVGGQDLTTVYTQLGRELQEELERLNASGDTERLAQVRTSFEQFLGKVNETRDKKDYQSLLWIGETYFGLGQGVKEDKAAAAVYYEKASNAYADILNGNLADAKSVPAIQLRQVRCKRAQAQYEEALRLAEQILAVNPMSIDVQFEAAYALSDWGADPNVGQPEKLLKSIEGMENAAGKKDIWGWQRLTTRLGARQSTPEWETLKERFLEARYEFIRSRLRYGNMGGPGADQQLSSAQSETTMFALVSPDLDDAWFAKFDTLYRDIQAARGEEPKPLERPEAVVIPPEELAPPVAMEDAGVLVEKEAAPTTVPPPEGPNVLLMTLALALLAGGGFAVFKMFSKPQKRTRNTFASDESFSPPVGGGVGGAGAADGGVPDFSGFGAVEAPAVGLRIPAPPTRKKAAPGTRPKKKPSTPEEAAAMQLARKKAAARAAAAKTSAAGTPGKAAAGQPVKKKRVLTPEEAARYRAAKAAKAKAAAAAGGQVTQSGAPQKKAVKKAPPGAQKPGAPQPAARRKVVKKRPPQPPPTE